MYSSVTASDTNQKEVIVWPLRTREAFPWALY